MKNIIKNTQYYKFCIYGFLKNFRFFDAFFILFLVDKGLSYTEIGLLYAIREIVINIFEIPSGILADTYGRRNVLAFSFLIFMISFILFYFSNGFWIFLPAFILFGIGDAFRSGTHKGMIMDYLKMNQWDAQKINYYGHTRSCSQKGSALSALMAGVIVFYSGNYESIFLYSLIPYLLNLVLILSYPQALNHSIKKAKHQSGIKETMQSFTLIIKQAHVLKIINTTAVHTAYIKAVKDYIQPLMLQISLVIPLLLSINAEKKSGIIIGLIYFIIYLISSAASKRAGILAKSNRKNIPHLTLLLGFGAGLLCGLFYYFDLWFLSLIAFIAIFIIENIRKPILTGYVADQVPNEILTSVLSAQSLLKTIITAILALTFGFMADHYGIGISFIAISSFLLLTTFILNIRIMNVNE